MRLDSGQSHAGWVFLRRWGPLCLWMIAISAFSTENFSADETSRFIEPFLRWLLPSATIGTIQVWHGVIRKGMHVAEFAVLALLWYRGLSWGKRGWQPAAALTAFGLSVLAAVGDEVHQAFVPSRTASAMDVAWDSLGAMCGLAGWGILAGVLQFGEKANAPEVNPPGRLRAPGGD
jgi:VanZ family protein